MWSLRPHQATERPRLGYPFNFVAQGIGTRRLGGLGERKGGGAKQRTGKRVWFVGGWYFLEMMCSLLRFEKLTKVTEVLHFRCLAMGQKGLVKRRQCSSMEPPSCFFDKWPIDGNGLKPRYPSEHPAKAFLKTTILKKLLENH